MNIRQHLGLQGMLRFVVRDENEAVREDTGQIENLITDAGIARIQSGNYLSHCHVGTGTDAPQVTDVTLSMPLAVTTERYTKYTDGTLVNRVQTSVEPDFWEIEYRYRFGQGVAAGNISEAGVGWADGLFDKVLITDQQGNPTTITVLPTDFLDVHFTMRVYPSSGGTFPLKVRDPEGTVLSEHLVEWQPLMNRAIPDSYYNQQVVGTAFNIINWTGNNGLVGSRFDSRIDQFRGFSQSYTTGSGNVYFGGKDWTPTRQNIDQTTSKFTTVWGINHMNDGLEGGEIAHRLGFVKFKISPKITKNNTEKLTHNLIFSWGRYTEDD